MKQSWMTHFSTWLASLSWAAALCFLVAIAISGCVVILLIDAALMKFSAWREKRAIRERNWILRQQRVQLILDAQREREQRLAAEDETECKRLAMHVWRDRVQSNRESKQFHLPAAFRDQKGVQR
jgi:hypothetical protein